MKRALNSVDMAGMKGESIIPFKAIEEAEKSIYILLEMKRDLFAMKEEKAKEKLLKADPDHREYLDLREDVAGQTAFENLQAIADAHHVYSYPGGKQTVDSAPLIQALKRRAGQFLQTGSVKGDDPQFGVTEKGRFITMALLTEQFAAQKKITPAYAVALRREGKLIVTKAEPFIPAPDKDEKPVSQPQENHATAVANKQASEDAKKAAAQKKTPAQLMPAAVDAIATAVALEAKETPKPLSDAEMDELLALRAEKAALLANGTVH